ncbi:MAG: molybdate ABC transporter substrate-binding protein [Stellaceae bacterium]
MRHPRRAIWILSLLLLPFGFTRAASAADVLVFAAASLKNALDDAAQTYRKAGGAAAKISYAASSALAKQIENGAPADIFISADLAWMDYVQKRNLIQPATRKNLLGNRLVLVAPAGRGVKIEVKPGFDLVGLLHGGRLAMADPASVPAGKYGKAALQKLGIWNAVEPQIAGAENVRAALLFVDRKETPLGIVYATDAASDPRVEIAGIFPENTHPPIIYPVALTASSKNPDAIKFLQFLESPKARPAFEKQGFAVRGAGG